MYLMQTCKSNNTADYMLALDSSINTLIFFFFSSQKSFYSNNIISEWIWIEKAEIEDSTNAYAIHRTH